MKKYAIYWESKITKKLGRGKEMFTLDRALDICKRQNLKFPDLAHWPDMKNTELSILLPRK